MFPLFPAPRPHRGNDTEDPFRRMDGHSSPLIDRNLRKLDVRSGRIIADKLVVVPLPLRNLVQLCANGSRSRG